MTPSHEPYDPPPPPQNPYFIEDLIDDVYPDPPHIPPGWVHVRSAAEIPAVTVLREDEGGGRGPSSSRGGGGGGGGGGGAATSIAAAAMRTTGKAARKAAERAGPGLGLAMDKTRSGAARAAESMRDFNERHQVVDRTWSAAASAAQAVKGINRKNDGTEKSAGQLKKGLKATIELARRRSSGGHSPPRP